MKSQKIKNLAMEVSSHALDQGRIAGVDFDVAVLTNLTRDHLDYHGTVEAYAEAKAKLFALPDLKALVLNLDDAFGRKIAQPRQSRDNEGVMRRRPEGRDEIESKWGGVTSTSLSTGNSGSIIAYGIGSVADYPAGSLVAENAVFDSSGISADICYGDQQAKFTAAVLGRFNLSNLLAALGSMLAIGQTLEEAVSTLSRVQTVAGRMEKVSDTGVLAVVDYAHTPNALETVLKALREHTQNRLICVFGCGGDRDAGKRPLMAKIAETNADVVIVTDDNPRSENPKTIMQDIVSGFIHADRITIEHDRANAINKALRAAASGDTVLIAGKGHENVQILATGTIPFSDREQANKVLQEMAA